MSEQTSTTTTQSVSITGLLGVAFVVLKLCGVIDWSWWWVTLPFWGGIALVIVIIGIVALVAVIVAALDR